MSSIRRHSRNLQGLSISIAFRCAFRLIATGYEKANSDTEQRSEWNNDASRSLSPNSPLASPRSLGRLDLRS